MSQLDPKKFPNMTAISGPPRLVRWNGCGPALFGKRDYDETSRSYVATLCVSIFYLPIVCLRSYRVARSPRGWYFLGREPLSTAAKAWNLALVTAVAITAAVVPYVQYTSTPAYKAKRQMAAAQAQVDQGHFADAARIYQTIAIAGADQSANASAAVKDLMTDQCHTAPLSEAGPVVASAADIARRGSGISLSDVADTGLKLAKDKGSSDPHAAVELLDAIRPLVIDTRPVDDLRLTLLRQWAAKEPGNLNVIVPLAGMLEEAGQLDDAKKLLLPVKDQLGDGEGSRVLGAILGRQGDYDGAYALLWPYVQGRLDKLHDAEKTANDTLNTLWDREIKALNDQKGPQDFYDKYKALNDDGQRALVRDYVNGRIKNDPEYTSTQDDLEKQAAVVPVALELGIVMVQRAQGQTDPDLRKTQLESAEKVFLAIGGIAGQSDEYRLTLGQVYYWLGRQAEGRKLFDDYLSDKGRGFDDLVGIATRLRQLGSFAEARAMAEEAYDKAVKQDQKYQAASLRAFCRKDLDDEITWRNKGDPTDPSNRAELAADNGEKAFQEGRDDEAVSQYRISIGIYDGMPRSTTTLNETALAYNSIFTITGDHAALDRCVDYFQQAVGLDPSNSILQFNAGITLLDSAIADLIGKDIDLRALHLTGDMSLLKYLYDDEAAHDATAKRVKEHPGVARAMSYLQRAMVLAPKYVDAYGEVFAICQFTCDEAALRTLEQKVRNAEPDSSDELAQIKDHLSGAKDNEDRTSITAAIKRSDDLIAKLLPQGGLTAAVALDREVQELFTLDGLGGPADLDKAVSLSEQAGKLEPSFWTRDTVIRAHLHHVAKALRNADPAFETFYNKCNRAVNANYLVGVAASEGGPFEMEVQQNAEFQSTLILLKELEQKFPDSHSPWEWAIFKFADSAEADKIAAAIRNESRVQVAQSVTSLLHPYDASDALDAYWLSQILGKPEEGRAAVRKVADMGIPIPVQGDATPQ